MPQIISIIRLISNLYKNWTLTLEEQKRKKYLPIFSRYQTEYYLYLCYQVKVNVKTTLIVSTI